MEELSKESASKIADALLAGKTIEAIKLYREETGTGLKEAKDYIEKLKLELKKDHPDAFPDKKGCAGVLVFGLISFGILGGFLADRWVG